MSVGGHQSVESLLEGVVVVLEVQLLHVAGLGAQRGQALEAGGQGEAEAAPGGERGLERHQLGQGRLGGVERGQDVLHRLDGGGRGRGGGLPVPGAAMTAVTAYMTAFMTAYLLD